MLYLELLEAMRVQDFINLQRFHVLAHEAVEAEKIIRRAYKQFFGLGQQIISVYHTESYAGYYGEATLSIDGKWHYHDNWWGGRDWEINVDADGIFQLFREAYYIENNLPHKLKHADIPAMHFRQFIEKTKAELSNQS